MDFLMMGADSVAGVSLTGEEMLEWTDMSSDPRTGSAVLTRAVLDALPTGGRVLLAGPHGDELIARLAAAGATVEQLVRSLADAQTSRLDHADVPVKVHCGSLTTFDGGDYDAVIALGGVAVLISPEQQLSWTEALSRLRRATRPGGMIAVALPNSFGLDRVADPRHGVRDTDADWPSGGPTSQTVTGLDAARRALDLAGLRTFALFPDLATPTTVVEDRCLAGPSADGLATAVAAAWAARSDTPTVADPRRLARDAVRAGLGCELAPAWLFVGRTGASLDAEEPEPVAYTDLPLAEPDLGVVQTLRRDPAVGWQRQALGTEQPRVAGRVTRSPKLLEGKVPAGPLLEEIVLDACARHDLGTVREILGRYARHLADPAQTPADRVFATLDNVVDAGQGLHPFDPSWSYARDVTPQVAAVRAFLRFARRLQSGAYENPWPVGSTAERLAITLATTAGLTVTDEEVRLAAEIDAELDQVFGDADPTDPAGWTVPRGHREALATVAKLNAALADTRAQVAWLDETVAERDQRLMEAAKIRKSITFRIGRIFTLPISTLVKLLRGAR